MPPQSNFWTSNHIIWTSCFWTHYALSLAKNSSGWRTSESHSIILAFFPHCLGLSSLRSMCVWVFAYALRLVVNRRVNNSNRKSNDDNSTMRCHLFRIVRCGCIWLLLLKWLFCFILFCFVTHICFSALLRTSFTLELSGLNVKLDLFRII